MGFKPVGWLSEDQARMRDSWIDSTEVRQLLKLDDTPVFDEKPIKTTTTAGAKIGDLRCVVPDGPVQAKRNPVTTFTSAEVGGHKGGGDPNYVPPGENVDRMQSIQAKLKEQMERRRT
jgi:hypothetical protein